MSVSHEVNKMEKSFDSLLFLAEEILATLTTKRNQVEIPQELKKAAVDWKLRFKVIKIDEANRKLDSLEHSLREISSNIDEFLFRLQEVEEKINKQ